MISAVETKNVVQEPEHILVCISPAPTCPRIIRAAARMASAIHCPLTALYVETPGEKLREKEARQLEANRALARSLSARLETVSGPDVALEITAYAQASGVSEIFIGRSGENSFLFGNTVGLRLIRYLPGVEIHIIPDDVTPRPRRHALLGMPIHFDIQDTLKMIGIMGAATLLCYIIWLSSYDNANIITIYLLAVLLTAAATREFVYSLMAAFASILLFNFFFTEPLYTLLVYDTRYWVTYLVLFAASVVAGSLAWRLKLSARSAAQSAYGTRVVYEAGELFQKAGSEEEIMDTACRQLLRLLNRTILCYPQREEGLGPCRIYAAPGDLEEDALIARERKIAEYVHAVNRHAGAGTDVYPDARYQYVSVRADQEKYGVLGIRMQEPLDSSESHLLLSLVGECAMAVSDLHSRLQKEQAQLEASKQKFRADLLRSISHDLRTPLTSITGNAETLLENGAQMDEETRRSICCDIRDDSSWLSGLVENLLAVTRLQEGVELHESTELVEDVVEEAVKHVDRRLAEHTLRIEIPDEMLTARMDSRLIIQVLVNLLNNAVKYTPPGSTITVEAHQEGDWTFISVCDNGPGVDAEDKPHIFELFFTGHHPTSDAGRSVGMGLSLCKSIVEAHGGKLTLKDNTPHGAVFTFCLKHEEVQMHDIKEESDISRGG